MLRAFAFICALFLSSHAFGEQPRTFILCSVKDVLDGDTIVVDVLLPWSVVLNDRSVRMQGYDAWEISKKRKTVRVTDAEIERGKAAREALVQILSAAEAVYLTPSDRHDPYGRLTAYVSLLYDGQLIEVSEWMREHGHTRIK